MLTVPPCANAVVQARCLRQPGFRPGVRVSERRTQKNPAIKEGRAGCWIGSSISERTSERERGRQGCRCVCVCVCVYTAQTREGGREGERERGRGGERERGRGGERERGREGGRETVRNGEKGRSSQLNNEGARETGRKSVILMRQHAWTRTGRSCCVCARRTWQRLCVHVDTCIYRDTEHAWQFHVRMRYVRPCAPHIHMYSCMRAS